MLVAVVGHSSKVAGAELSLVYCVERIVKAGHSCVVFLPERGPLVPRIEGIFGDIRIIYLRNRPWMGARHLWYFGLVGLTRLVQSCWDSTRFVSWFRTIKPDAVLVISSVTPAPLLAASHLRLPSVLTLGESLESNPTLKSVLPKRIIAKVISQTSDLVLASSRFAQSQYKHPSQVVYPELRVEPYEQKGQRSTIKLAMVGNLSEEKGQIRALSALKILMSKGVPFELEFWGDGPAREVKKLRRAILVNGLSEKVQYRGRSDDVHTIYRSVSLTIVNSRNEAFGKVTLESIANETPVVGLKAGGTTEILTHGGGLLVNDSPIDLANALESVLRDEALRDQLVAECRVHPMVHMKVPDRTMIASYLQSAVGMRANGGEVYRTDQRS